MNDASTSQQQPQTLAITLALGSYVLWGVLPVYWKLLAHLPAPQIFCHRIIWSAVFGFILLLISRRLNEIRDIFSRPALVARLTVSGLLVGGNWLIYIWAVNAGHLIEASLGYFTMPLLSVLLGIVIFRDRPRLLQVIGILCAVAGVAVQIVSHGRLPLIALGLAFTFSLYGVVRKSTRIEAIPGFLVETTLLAPLALLYLIVSAQEGPDAFFSSGPDVKLLLMGAGVVTALPMLGFGFAARRLSLVTLGLLQYIAPSLTFCIGAFVYKEPLDLSMLITFGCIWFALSLYTFEGWRAARRARLFRRVPGNNPL